MPKIVPWDESNRKLVVCQTCFAQIGYMPDEVTRDTDGDGDVRFWIRCPKCQAETRVGRPAP